MLKLEDCSVTQFNFLAVMSNDSWRSIQANIRPDAEYSAIRVSDQETVLLYNGSKTVTDHIMLQHRDSKVLYAATTIYQLREKKVNIIKDRRGWEYGNLTQQDKVDILNGDLCRWIKNINR